MDQTTLAAWRDASLILLAIEAIVIMLIPGALFFFAVRGMHALRRGIRPPLKNAQVWALRIQRGTTRAMDGIAGAQIGIASRATLVSATTRGVVNFLLGK